MKELDLFFLGMVFFIIVLIAVLVALLAILFPPQPAEVNMSENITVLFCDPSVCGLNGSCVSSLAVVCNNSSMCSVFSGDDYHLLKCIYDSALSRDDCDLMGSKEAVDPLSGVRINIKECIRRFDNSSGAVA